MVYRHNILPDETWFYVHGSIIDWYSRYIVGFELSNTLERTFVLEAIKKAIKRYGKPEIMNSDQGSQFTSDDYINLLKSNNIKISMDGKGRALDNQRIERFFRSYKWEKLYLEDCETGHQLRQITRDYVEYYNNRRPHQSLDYKTPAEYYFGFTNSFRQSYKTLGSAPNPVLAGRQPVCHDRPERKMMYVYWMSRVKMNSLTLALDILRHSK